MVSCEELYSTWRRKGNFCRKSENTARQIENYMEYREKYKLESYEINRCALYPLMQIEKFEYVHKHAIMALKKKCRKIGGRRITRRLMIEIINQVNDTVDIRYKITHIPQVRNRVTGYEHELSELSFEVREAFDKLKEVTGIKSNNLLMLAMTSFASKHKDKLLETSEMIEAARAQEEALDQEDNEQEITVVSTP